MKRVIIGSSAAVLFALSASCGSDATAPKASGGAPMASGGALSTGGTPGNSGTGSGLGGSAMTSGGTSQLGGSSSTSGGATSGGSSGSAQGGSAAAGASGQAGAGAGSSGAAGAAGGVNGGASSGGSGGAGGASGSSGGGSAGAGGATAGAGGAAGAEDLVTTVAKSWDGALVTYPCGNSGTGYDCANIGCTNNMATKTTTWMLGGDSSKVYAVTFNVRGILEAYAYDGGTRDAGNASITQNKDLFLRGGKPQGQGGANYDYNVYGLEITPPVTGEPNVYYLNSVTTAEGPHAPNTPTSHLTFDISYNDKTIKVMGGGTVTLKLFDSNCTLVQNCGPTSGNTCSNPRSVSFTGATPPPPSSFMQPFQMPSGKFGQWVFFDVTNVVVAK